MSNKFVDLFPRIEYAVERFYGGNVSGFAKKVGIQRQLYYHWKSEYEKEGKEPNPGFQVLYNILNTSTINPAWLLTGKGQPGQQKKLAVIADLDRKDADLLNGSSKTDRSQDENTALVLKELKDLIDFLEE